MLQVGMTLFCKVYCVHHVIVLIHPTEILFVFNMFVRYSPLLLMEIVLN